MAEDIPLNQGCLKPIDVRIPDRSFLSPSENAAVVGGNVLTVSSPCHYMRCFQVDFNPTESKSHGRGVEGL